MTVTLTSACRFSAEDHALQCAEWTTVKCQSPFQFRTCVKCPSAFQFRTDFCRCAEHFHDCILASPQVRFFFQNSDVRTDRGRPLPFGRSTTSVELISFSFSGLPTLVLVQFFPENVLNKLCHFQFFS